jgi:hypothetical protein
LARNPKIVWYIAHENCQNMRKRRVFTTRSNRVLGIMGPSISARNPKTMCYSPQKRPKYAKTVSFDGHPANRIPRVMKSGNPSETLKLCAIAHRNGQNMRKLRVSTTPSNRVLRVTNSANRPGTQKLCAITQKTAKICGNDEF